MESGASLPRRRRSQDDRTGGIPPPSSDRMRHHRWSTAMTQHTATEKDMFLQSFERECQTTLKILRAYPAAKADFRPAEKSRTAKELAATFVLEQGLAGKALAGTLDWSKMGPMPTIDGTLPEIIAMFEKAANETAS